MSNGCCAAGMDRFFSKASRYYAGKFRRKGPDKASRILIEQLVMLGVDAGTILDIGCGTGDVHLTLLQKGALSAVGIDVSSGMLEQARMLSEELEVDDRVRYVHGDMAMIDGRTGSADIVVMDKVLCCYPDPELLIENATALTDRFLALSYPRRSWIVAMIFGSLDYLGKLLGWSFHPFYHDPEVLEGSVLQRKFKEMFSGNTFMWQLKIFGTDEWTSAAEL